MLQNTPSTEMKQDGHVMILTEAERWVHRRLTWQVRKICEKSYKKSVRRISLKLCKHDRKKG